MCDREWVEPKFHYINSAPVSITGNPINLPMCPICGSGEIELIEFKPFLPGMDIPRGGEYSIIPTKIHAVIKSTTSNKDHSIRSEMPRTLVEHMRKMPDIPSEIKPAEDLINPPLTLPEEREANREEYDPFDLGDMD